MPSSAAIQAVAPQAPQTNGAGYAVATPVVANGVPNGNTPTGTANASPTKLAVVGFNGNPSHQKCLRLLQRLETTHGHLFSTASVVTLPDAQAYSDWLHKNGRASAAWLGNVGDCPDCTLSAKFLGGEAELRVAVVNMLEQDNQERGNSGLTIVILCQKKDKGKRWILDLRLALAVAGTRTLLFLVDPGFGASTIWGDTEEGGGGLRSASGANPKAVDWQLLINAVSDTAPQEAQRNLVSIMEATELVGIPILNGIGAHKACSTKVGQHQMCADLGLPTPRTVVVPELSGKGLGQAADTAALQYPLLLKGGNFGSRRHGMTTFASRDEMARINIASDESVPADGPALLQEMVLPKGGRIGRIWVVDFKMMCAVQCLPGGVGGNGETEEGAAAWDPPPRVRNEVEQMARLAGAAWGCIEVICPFNLSNSWFYFDINLACFPSFPDPAGISDPTGIWAKGVDPYADVASFILKFLEGRNLTEYEKQQAQAPSLVKINGIVEAQAGLSVEEFDLPMSPRREPSLACCIPCQASKEDPGDTIQITQIPQITPGTFAKASSREATVPGSLSRNQVLV